MNELREKTRQTLLPMKELFPEDVWAFLVAAVDGPTLRDQFAGQALQGLLAYEGENGPERGDFSITAYQMADAMLWARTQGEKR